MTLAPNIPGFRDLPSYLLLCLLLFFTSLLHAKLPPPLIEFEHITTEDGLSNGTVYDIIQDQQGFMWFATANGLNKYDGYEFTVYLPNPDDPHSVSGTLFIRLFIDNQDTLWAVSIGGGLNRYDPKTDRFIRYLHNPNNPTSLSTNRVYSIAEDHEGHLWITTIDNGLSRFDRKTEQFTHYFHDPNDPHSLLSNQLNGVFVDSRGLVWIGSAKGVERYDPQTDQFIHYTAHGSQSDWPEFRAINFNEDKQGNLWIASIGHGLFKYDYENDQVTNYRHSSKQPDSLVFDQVLFPFFDSQGTLWLTTWGGGVDVYDPKTNRFIHYQHDSNNSKTLANNGTWGIYEDRSGVIWIGTYGSGINKYDRKQERFSLMKHHPQDKNSLSYNQVKTIFEDSQGLLWLGTLSQGGLNKYEASTDTFTHYQHNPDTPTSISHNEIWSIAEDHNQDLWIATSNGLNRFDRQTEKFFRYHHSSDVPNSLSSNIVRSVHIDYMGQIWIGHQVTGVDRFDPIHQTFTNYPMGSAANYVIYEDRANTLYVGNLGGFHQYDRNRDKFIRYVYDANNPNSLVSNFVNAIHEDGSGNLWIGTVGGLDRFDPATGIFHHYGTQTGLIDNDITGILDGSHGKLWISTTKGLSEFNNQTQITRNYKINSFIKNAYFKSKVGELFFGGNQGLTHFFPDAIADNSNSPPIVLTTFKKFNKVVSFHQPLSQIKTLDLSYSDRVISIEFAALDYSNPKENRYMYKLEGIDPDWVEVGADRRFATYTNLESGNYTFRVVGSNNDGKWNHQGVTLHLSVSPPPWKTWWAYSLYLMLVLTCFWGYVRFQAKKLEREQQINERLEKLVYERTEELRVSRDKEKEARAKAEVANRAKSDFLAHMSHEIRTPMNAILGFSEIMKTKLADPQLIGYLASIYSSGKSLLRLINDILDLSKVESGKLELEYSPTSPQKLFKEMEIVFGQAAQEKGLTFLIEIDPDLPEILILDETRLRQILINLLGNAVKFTKDGYVKLSAKGHSSQASHPQHFDFTFSIEDTGKGIPKDQQDVIFQAFSQVEGQSFSQYGGTGLGLTITQQLIEIMHGKIELTSEEGKGTTFQIILHGVKIPDSSDSHKPLSDDIDLDALTFKGSSILIADDIEFNRELIKGFLDSYDLTLLEAIDGQEALVQAQTAHPALILMDIKMPKMNGLEVTTLLKKDPMLQAIPIITVTASAMKEEEDVLKTLSEGYLTKPINKKALILELIKFLPHTLEERSAAPSLLDELSPQALPKLPYVLEKLEEELTPKWETLKQKQPMKEVMHFGKTLKELGKQYEIPILQQYGEQIITSVDDFDISGIRSALKQFPNLKTHLRSFGMPQ